MYLEEEGGWVGGWVGRWSYLEAEEAVDERRGGDKGD